MTLNSHDGCKRSWMRRTALEHLSPPHQLRLQQSTAIMTATFAAAPQPLLLPAEVEQRIYLVTNTVLERGTVCYAARPT